MRVCSPQMTLLKPMMVHFTLPFISPLTSSLIDGVRGEVGRVKGEGGKVENGKVEWSEGERGRKRRIEGGGERNGITIAIHQAMLYMYYANCRRFRMAVLRCTLSITQPKQSRTHRYNQVFLRYCTSLTKHVFLQLG